MFEDYVIININGVNYYCESSVVKNLKFINGKLVNISNSSISLVSDFDYQYTVYPRIQCSSMRQCYLQQSQNSNYIPITTDISYNKNNLSVYSDKIYLFIFMFIVCTYCLYKLMIKR